MNQEQAVSANSLTDESVVSPEGVESQGVAPVVKEKPGFQFLASRPVIVESADEMAAVIERHQHWIASVLNPRAEVMEGRANISGSNVSGFDLSGADLRGVNFSKCIMHGTNFQNCNLNGANFSHADLQGADLRGASVRRTIFDYADLREAEIDGVDFSVASHSHAIMTPVKIQSEESNSCNATTGLSPLVERSDSQPDSNI